MQIELTENELKDIVKEGYYGMSLLRAKCGKVIYEDVFNSVFDEDNNIIEGICLKNEVRQFLITCKFPLIITTSCFPIVEKELGFKYTSYWNELEIKNDAPLPDKCIYHLFGEAKLENSNWGYNDKQVLSFLRSALSSEYSLKNLTAKIGNKNSRQTLLILGNDSPDWLFRFILTPIYGGDVYDDKKGFYISDQGRVEYDSLNQFLRDIKFEKETQLIEVLQKVSAKFNDLSVFRQSNHGKKYDFFIAHAGGDREIAEKLVSKMREKLNVWVDYENNKDGLYWQRIIDALKDSAYFMPLITEKYIQKNKKNSDLKNVLKQLSIDDVSIDMAECVKLESYLEGVQIELLIANKWFEMSHRETYSIPVILKGSTLFFEPITTTSIRNWSEESKLLPQNLFWGVQMYEFDENSPQNFVLDWNRYKSLIEN